MSDKLASDHEWDIEQAAHTMLDDSGFVVKVPTGYGEFRCSCGVLEQGKMEEVVAKANDHPGIDATVWRP